MRHTPSLLALPLALLVLSSCHRDPSSGPGRIVEREETIAGAPVQLRSELRPSRGTLGDPIGWTLTASVGDSVAPMALTVAEPSASLEVQSRAAQSVARERGGVTMTHEFTVRGFDLGGVALPEARLTFRHGTRTDTLAFPPDTLFVDSLTQAVTGSLRPDRGAIQPDLRPVDYAVAAGIALLALVAMAAVVALLLRARRGRRASVAEAEAPEPPESALIRALAALREELSALPRDVFYERLSFALRAYAQAATGVPALDFTTGELDRALDARPGVDRDGRHALIATLTRADLAKFARYRDEAAEAAAVLAQAVALAGTLTAPPSPLPGRSVRPD